jgi:hypothetical protein
MPGALRDDTRPEDQECQNSGRRGEGGYDGDRMVPLGGVDGIAARVAASPNRAFAGSRAARIEFAGGSNFSRCHPARDVAHLLADIVAPSAPRPSGVLSQPQHEHH